MAVMPILRPLVLASALLGAALAVSAADRPASDPSLPSDAELEAARAHIGKIEVHTVQIFDLTDPADNNWLFRTADRLHKRTRDSVILAQLLFRSGDPYSRRILEETARNIRLNSSFLREPVIRPIRYHDGLVDIEVTTHDVWTFEPGVDFSRSGGTNSSGVDIADANFLGYGKYVEIGHGENVDRSSNFLRWQDPNVWGSHWVDAAVYSNNSDGTVWGLAGGLPFYSLESRSAAGIDFGDNHSVVTRYRLGQAYDGYSVNDHAGDLFIGRALVITDRWTERLLLGWRVDNDNFSAPVGQTPLAPIPQNRELSYPFVRMQWVENHFDTMHNLDLIARTEDVHFGLDASLGLGWATPDLGSDRHSVLADTELNYGWRFSDTEEMFLTSRLASRFEDGGLRDAMLTWGAAYFLSTSDMTRLLVRFTGDAGHDLDGDHTVQLGGDTGLRGYPLRYQNGNQRALFTIEERLYTNWYLFRLFNVGAAAFYDMGRTWGTTLVPTPQLGLLKDAGLGLRFGNARSSFGSVIHVDVAVPFDRAAGVDISSVQFLVSTEQSF
jgi:outer membrane protein assembly factor BamA